MYQKDEDFLYTADLHPNYTQESRKMAGWDQNGENFFSHLYFEISNLLLCERHFREEWICLLRGSNSVGHKVVRNKMQGKQVFNSNASSVCNNL